MMRGAGPIVSTPEKNIKIPRLPLRFADDATGRAAGKTPRSSRNATGKTPRSRLSGADPAAAGGATPTGPVEATRSPMDAFAAQMNEFIMRGTPRSTPVAASPRISRGLSLRRLEQHLAGWIQARGLPPLMVRALAVHAHDDGTTGTARGSSAEAGGMDAATRFVALHEASIMFSGVEVHVTVSVPNLSGPVSARAIEPKLVAAQSHCAWPAAQRRLTAAVEAASGRSLEEFLDALWADGVPWGASRDQGLPEHLTAALSPFSTPQHMLKEEDDDIISSDGSPLESSSRSSASSALRRQSCDAGATDGGCAESCDAEENTFADWLLNCRPIWRSEHAAGGKAWDWPQSKVEKREFLVLTLIEEARERQQLMLRACHEDGGED